MGCIFRRCEGLRSGRRKRAANCQNRCFAQADLGQCESTGGTPQTAHAHSGVTPPRDTFRGHWREPAASISGKRKRASLWGRDAPSFAYKAHLIHRPCLFCLRPCQRLEPAHRPLERMAGRDSLTTLTTRGHWQRVPASPPQGCLFRRSAGPRPAARQASGNRRCPWSCRSGGPSGRTRCRHARWPSRAPRSALPSR